MATTMTKNRKAAGKPSVHPDIEAVLFNQAQISKRIDVLAKEINAEYKDRYLIMVAILKGSFIFLGDLLRRLTVPVEVDFLSLSSYIGDRSSEMVKLNFDIRLDVKDRDVLLVDDIVDTGFSLTFARKHILSKGAQEVDVCVLLDKPERRKVLVPVRYTGFIVPDRFVVGYGLDYNERYRELPYIGVLKSRRLEP